MALNTLGDHLKARRLELNLSQIEVAERLHVNEMTVVNWERNYTRPLVSHIPIVIAFLGYTPEGLFAVDSMADKIKRHRELLGMDMRMFAKEIGIDTRTLARIETGKSVRRKVLEKISLFLKLPKKLSNR